jgi:MbtH protein
MTNPFDDENATYVVLVNDEEQYSLWPVLIDVPGGWRVVHPADSRKACIDFINRNWTATVDFSHYGRTAHTLAWISTARN